MRRTAIAVALASAALLSGWASQASACPGANRQPNRQSADDARRAMKCLINRRRSHRGLRRLQASIALGAAAQGHSDAMASENFFSHDGVDGTPASRAEAAGYISGARTWGLGENLEWASGRAATARAVIDGWMKSAEHRDVMFSRRFRQIGIGVTHGSPVSPDVENAAIFTADFGFRKG
jgi:uncharacterized protein YkwD